ncbi:MAG: hypothetical protein ACOYEV_08390 [Candidatus Nanopelagicales bacterium]
MNAVPADRRRARWAVALLPLLVTMPVRAAGVAQLAARSETVSQTPVVAGLLVHLLWVSAAVPYCVLVTAIASRWVRRPAAVAVAGALSAGWIALDIAAPALIFGRSAVSTLGPVIDTLMSLTGHVQLSAALVVIAVTVLGAVLAGVLTWALQSGRPLAESATAPLSRRSVAGAGAALSLAYLPILLTLVLSLAGGARPWRICSPPTGCAPLVTTAGLLIPTALAATFLAGTAYFAGWLNPLYRRAGPLVGMAAGCLLPPTALGVSLWLTAVYFHIARGLATLFVGQVLVASAMAFALVAVAQSRVPAYSLATGVPGEVTDRLRRAALYGGALGALYASSDFALAFQLSGSVVTVPTSAYAEVAALGEASNEVMGSLIWAAIVMPLFLLLLSRVVAMASTNAAPEHLEHSPAT